MAKKNDKEVKENQAIYNLASSKGINIAQARQEYYDPLKETAKAATSKNTTPSKVITAKTSPSQKPANYSAYNYSPMYGNRKNMTAQGDAGLPTAVQAQIKRNQAQWLLGQQTGNQALMDGAHAANEAIRSGFGYLGGDDGSGYFEQTDKYGDFAYQSAPVFYDAYGNQIADQRNKILNREAFSYNPEEDPLYAVYKAQYNREGNRATQNTIGEMAARTGGMASSYAGTAAAQAGQYYAQQLADRIPELQQLAYSMHMDDLNMSRQDLAMLEGASDRDYGRYMDSYGMWNDDRNFAYGGYRDQVGDKQWQETFDRNVLESDRAYEQAERQIAETIRMNNISIDQWNQSSATEKAAMFLQSGITPNAALLETAGIDPNTAKTLADQIQGDRAFERQRATRSSSSGGGGGGISKSDEEAQSYEWNGGGTTSNVGGEWDALKASYAQDGLTLDMDSIVASAGAVSPEELERKIKSGEIVESKVGNVVKFIKAPQKNYGNIYPW